MTSFENELKHLYQSVKPNDLAEALISFRSAKEDLLRKIDTVASDWQSWVDQGAAQRSEARASKKAIRRTE